MDCCHCKGKTLHPVIARAMPEPQTLTTFEFGRPAAPVAISQSQNYGDSHVATSLLLGMTVGAFIFPRRRKRYTFSFSAERKST